MKGNIAGYQRWTKQHCQCSSTTSRYYVAVDPVHRRAPSHHSGGGSIAGSPRAVRALTDNIDRPLMPIFNVEEAVPPAAPNLLTDNVMAMFDE